MVGMPNLFRNPARQLYFDTNAYDDKPFEFRKSVTAHSEKVEGYPHQMKNGYNVIGIMKAILAHLQVPQDSLHVVPEIIKDMVQFNDYVRRKVVPTRDAAKDIMLVVDYATNKLAYILVRRQFMYVFAEANAESKELPGALRKVCNQVEQWMSPPPNNASALSLVDGKSNLRVIPVSARSVQKRDSNVLQDRINRSWIWGVALLLAGLPSRKRNLTPLGLKKVSLLTTRDVQLAWDCFLLVMQSRVDEIRDKKNLDLQKGGGIPINESFSPQFAKKVETGSASASSGEGLLSEPIATSDMAFHPNFGRR